MGYGLPAALAAKLRHPDRPVLCFIGDGGFQMCALELATAVQEDLAVVVIVVNNGMYGTIRSFQERRYPGRVVATALANPDFVALAQACGAHAESGRAHRRSSRPRLSAPSPPAAPPSSSCAPTPSRSRPARRSPRSASAPPADPRRGRAALTDARPPPSRSGPWALRGSSPCRRGCAGSRARCRRRRCGRTATRSCRCGVDARRRGRGSRR